jgi:hypothetical protein
VHSLTHSLTYSLTYILAMLALDVFIWVVLPLLHFFYWLNAGEEAFIAAHLRSCHSATPSHTHSDSHSYSHSALQQESPYSLTQSEMLMKPPHFSSQGAKAFQRHKGDAVTIPPLTHSLIHSLTQSSYHYIIITTLSRVYFTSTNSLPSLLYIYMYMCVCACACACVCVCVCVCI